MVRILLIEDDDDLRHGLAGMLRRAGHDITEASDGRAGLSKLVESVPDIMITDLVMDGMEGIETIREVRRRWPHMLIVAISASALYLENSRRLGADAALLKPFTKAQLLATIDGGTACQTNLPDKQSIPSGQSAAASIRSISASESPK